MNNVFKFTLLLLILSFSMVQAGTISHKNSIIQNNSTPVSDFDLFLNSIQINTHDNTQVIDGKNIFSIRRQNLSRGNYDQNFVAVMDMEGNIEASLELNKVGLYFADPEMINSSTALLRNETLLLWNIETGVVQNLGIKSPFHEVEYNPITNSYLGKYFSPVNESGTVIDYNDLVEFDSSGNEIWRWNNSIEFPYDANLTSSAFFQGRQRWLHINSIDWDVDNDVLYFNANNLDTFYKLNKITKEIEWGLGRLGDFTMYNKAGKQVDALFYHAHAVEYLGENRFILYDNDAFNKSRNTETGVPRFVEIEIDETKKEAREIWSYTGAVEKWSRIWGDADRLPNGNTLGDFGAIGQSNWLTEVNPEGEIVWEAEFVLKDGYGFQSYRTERFYDQPIINHNVNTVVDGLTDLDISIEFWNTIRERLDTDALLKITVGEELFSETTERFKANWQGTKYNITIPAVKITGDIIIEVTNADGVSHTSIIQVDLPVSETKSSTETAPLLGIFGFVLIMMVRYSTYRNYKNI